MILVIIRTLILFTVTFIFLRIMGKRQIGQLQPYELVIIIMISELAAIPMENTSIPLLGGLIPIFVLFVVQVTLAYISLKSEKIRGIICGKPSILVENSKINEEELSRLRYNLSDLLEQLRSKNAPNIADVEYAVLETGGQLSVIFKSQKRPVTPEDLSITTKYEGLPTTIIIDGHVNEDNLKKINLSLAWLQGELSKFGINNVKDVFFASLDTEGKLFYQLKTSTGERFKGVLANP
ncbi:MAG: DUF421 domain-containing protein [Syntrophomonadaceae bacterium]|nr:DUF421 domain-containing protein [Syntrophomonadaceae bacterium]